MELACKFLLTERRFGRTFVLPRLRVAAFLHSLDPSRTLDGRRGQWKLLERCIGPYGYRENRYYL
jgi:hypothetical protein